MLPQLALLPSQRVAFGNLIHAHILFSMLNLDILSSRGELIGAAFNER